MLIACLSLGLVATASAAVGNWLQICMPVDTTGPTDMAVESVWRRAASALEIIVYLASIIAFSIWSYAVVRNAHALADEPPAFSPGWAVGLHFIPLLNLWLPYLALRSARDRLIVAGGMPGAKWLLPLWWGLWLAANLIGTVTILNVASAETRDALRRAASTDLARNGCDLLLYVSTIAVARGLTKTATHSASASTLLRAPSA
jgi:hypothetical protein